MSVKRKNIEKPITPTTKKPKFDPKTPPGTNNKSTPLLTEKPEDWTKFKQEKKELKLKRKKAKSGFDVITKAKKMGEKLRCKKLKGGPSERNNLTNELHSLLRSNQFYPKFVLAHDTSRIVQWLLKYSSDIVKEQISKELIPTSLDMLQSKYGIFCIKRLLKYGSTTTKSQIIDSFYGNVVKLTTNILSAPVIEQAYTNFATPLQKQHLRQEFYGEIYRNSKDDKVKTLGDVYRDTQNLKAATLSSVKSNLMKVINKNLLDSQLVHTVLLEYFSECSAEDRAEIITALISHVVVISNSKDGATVAMQCLWYGSNKDRKNAMKTIKEHVVEMAKHEHSHCLLIALLDSIDDTVLLNKMILAPILKEAKDLAQNEWGKKVLMWLIAPGNSSFFHPKFVQQLEQGRQESNSKKEADLRRKEIREHCIETLLNLVRDEPAFWLENASKAFEMLAIVKAGSGEMLQNALEALSNVIIDLNWEISDGKKEIKGIEHSGLHMVLKKLAQNDRNLTEENDKFGRILTNNLNKDTLKQWLGSNRGCFLLVTIYENNSPEVQEMLKKKLKKLKKTLESTESVGGKLLLKKIQES